MPDNQQLNMSDDASLSRSEQKRLQVLRAAMELFSNNGYPNTSMDEVAKHAGVSKQTVYSHFGSKDVLFTAAIESKCVVHQLTSYLLDDPSQPEKALTTFAMQFGNMIVTEEALTVFKACVAQYDTHPETSVLYFAAGPDHVIGLLELYLAKVNQLGKYNFTKPRDCAVRYCLMLFGERRMRMELGLDIEDSNDDRHQYLADTASMFLKAYLVTPS